MVVYRTLPKIRAEDLGLDDRQRVNARLGDHIRLLGYRLEAKEPSAGETVKVTLFWQPDDELRGNYHVFVHLLDERGKLITQHDGIPMWGELPTWSWWKGEIVQDEHPLVLGENLPHGDYPLRVGMYDAATMVRVPALTSAGESLPNDAVPLGIIEIGQE